MLAYQQWSLHYKVLMQSLKFGVGIEHNNAPLIQFREY